METTLLSNDGATESLDRKKGEEGKGNLKKKLSSMERLQIFLFLSRGEQDSMNMVVTEEIFGDTDQISALALQNFIVIIYSGLTF